jgi:hypothetical protein
MQKRFPLAGGELLAVAGAASLVFTISKELGARGWVPVAIATSVFFAISCTWALSRLWQYEGNRFQLVQEKQSEPTLGPIADSCESILLAHLGTVVPLET